MIDELDRRLGMNRPITRRDLLHGFGAITAGIVLPSSASKHKAPSLPKTESSSGFYPPALTGMRGNHLGSYEVMHKLTRGDKTSWTSPPKRDKDHYDLVIVGAGISGLSAAYFFQKERPDARILLLDNHDDFGGHAKRNEFEVDGRKLISYGGAQTMAAPSRYPRVVKRLLRELGVDMGAFNKAYDQTFYRRHKLSGGIHFNKELWGNDATIPFDVAIKPRHLRDLERECRYLEEHKFSFEHTMFSKEKTQELLGTKAYIGALLNMGNGHLHPLNLCLGEAAAAMSLGAKIYERSPAIRIERGNKATVVTHGGSVTADSVILAGNAYHFLEPRLRGNLLPVNSFIVASEPLSAELIEEINPRDLAVCDPNYILTYFRLSGDGRLLFGGRFTYLITEVTCKARAGYHAFDAIYTSIDHTKRF